MRDGSQHKNLGSLPTEESFSPIRKVYEYLYVRMLMFNSVVYTIGNINIGDFESGAMHLSAFRPKLVTSQKADWHIPCVSDEYTLIRRIITNQIQGADDATVRPQSGSRTWHIRQFGVIAPLVGSKLGIECRGRLFAQLGLANCQSHISQHFDSS